MTAVSDDVAGAHAVDFEAEGLLAGLDGDEHEGRRRLLAELHADGVSLEELRRAVAEGRLALLPLERVFAGRRHTAREIARSSGVEVDTLLAIRQAVGLAGPDPDEAAFTEQDAEMAQLIARLRDAGVPAEGLIETARVVGRGLAPASDAIRTLFAETLMRPGDTEADLAHRWARAARELQPLVGPLISNALQLHLRHGIERDALHLAEISSGALAGARDVTVCFADLVGFTAFSEHADPHEVGTVASRLAALATDVARDPVRLVKLLGDGVLLVAPDVAPAVDVALELVETVADDPELPSLRAGLAAGPARPRAGDWYGRPVNLASRVSALARPDSVLVTGELRAALDAGRYRFSYMRARHLKGVRERVPLYRVRRAPSG